MKISILIGVIALLSCGISFGQNDSLQIRSEIGIRGRWQTGNLNQLAINPNAKLVVSKDKFNTELQADYQYLNVNKFVVKSDFWISGIYQYKPNSTIYPILIARFGQSKSFRIDRSLLTGIGAGINIRKKSETDLIQINAFGGYQNFKFEKQNQHSSLAGGLLLKLINPIAQRINILWELNSYHSGSDIQFWGIGNVVILQYKIHQNIHLNLTHNMTYNNQSIEDIKKTNTLMLFGISYQYNYQG